jgi:hypothetical protein
MDRWEQRGNGGGTNEGSDTPQDDSREHPSLKKEEKTKRPTPVTASPAPYFLYSPIPPSSFISPISTFSVLSTTDTPTSYFLNNDNHNDNHNNNHSNNTL